MELLFKENSKRIFVLLRSDEHVSQTSTCVFIMKWTVFSRFIFVPQNSLPVWLTVTTAVPRACVYTRVTRHNCRIRKGILFCLFFCPSYSVAEVRQVERSPDILSSGYLEDRTPVPWGGACCSIILY